MTDLRIASFLPAATEMACALGLGEQLLGVSHECDFPPAVRGKPVVSRNALPVDRMTPAEIDAAVAERIGCGESLYDIDAELLERLAPTHILTQSLCEVCAPSGNEITRALAQLSSKPEVLCFTPHRLEDVHDNLLDLGRATGRSPEAQAIVADSHARLDAVARRVACASRRPRLLFLEWTDPCFCAGHWVPEMISIAGGDDPFGRTGADSARIAWAGIAAWRPEVVIVSPCGYRVEKAAELAGRLVDQPGWAELPAVRSGRVYAVDANAYFARPGPRVADGVELLAHLIHPDLFAWRGPAHASRRLELGRRPAPREGN